MCFKKHDETTTYKVGFRNDVLFKYVLNGHNEESIYLLSLLVKECTHLDFKDLTILNPNLDKSHVLDKNFILDISVRTDTGEFINIEMQNTKIGDALRARFQLYMFRKESDQLSSGEDYSQLKAGYQVNLMDYVDDERRKLVDRYELRNEDNQVYKNNLVHIIDVQMPLINEIVKEQGIESLDEFKLMIYIFENGIDDAIMELAKEKKVVRYMKSLQDQFNMDEELRDIALKKELMAKQIQTQANVNYNHGYQTGVDDGVGIGICQGIIKYVQKVYHEDISSLIKGLSLDELNYVQDNIYDLNNIEEIKELIKKIG